MFLKLDGDEYLALQHIESVSYNKFFKYIELRTSGGRVHTVPIPKTKGTDWQACMDFMLRKIAESHKIEPKVLVKIVPTTRGVS